MPRTDPVADRTLLRVAQLYYEQGLTQAEIAARVHVTRWKVGRLLEEARQTGIVRIEIVHPRARCHLEEEALRHRFGLEDAVVVPAVESPEGRRRQVAAAAAEYLADIRPQPRNLAVSWGQTLDDLVEQIPPGWTRGVVVVQANGGLSRTGRSASASVVSELARQGVGTAVHLPAPAIVETAQLGAALSADAAIRRVLDLARGADAVVFSLGALTPSSVLVATGYLSTRDVESLRRRGAVGDVFARFVNADGEPVDPDLERRTIGLSLEDLRRSKASIAVAAGDEKVAVARAALHSGLCRVLVTDQRVARSVLDDPASEHSPA